MNNARSIVTTPTQEAVANGLQLALEAAQRLAEAGCKVVGAAVTSTQATIHVSNPPPFVTGGIKSRFRDPAGGTVYVMATRYFGVQLEWMALQRGSQVVGHA
ncbi:MAG TPA: hypothetical protein VGF12_09440 [Roseateles sp.]|uniref:hypothetical protein n=1 Tax=Roseateles sp. TaxID=1971397 RepID=UPI002EDA7728